MIRANIEAEIDSLLWRIKEKNEQVKKLDNLILKQVERLKEVEKERDDLIYKLNEIKEQLEDLCND